MVEHNMLVTYEADFSRHLVQIAIKFNEVDFFNLEIVSHQLDKGSYRNVLTYSLFGCSCEWNEGLRLCCFLFQCCPCNYFRKISDQDPMFHRSSCFHVTYQLVKGLSIKVHYFMTLRHQSFNYLLIRDSFKLLGHYSIIFKRYFKASSFYQHIVQTP